MKETLQITINNLFTYHSSINEEGVTVIDVNDDESSSKPTPVDHRGLAVFDPVQELFQNANLRAQKSRRSTADLHLPVVLNHGGKDSRFAHSSAMKIESVTHALKWTKGSRRASHISKLILQHPSASPHLSPHDHKTSSGTSGNKLK